MDILDKEWYNIFMTYTEREAIFPQEIPVDPDKETRAIYIGLEQDLYANRSIKESFAQVDAAYEANRLARVKFMSDSVFRSSVLPLDLSLVHDERDAKTTDLEVVLSPANDGAPQSSHVTLFESIITNPKPNGKDIRLAQPNSWGPATKLDIDYEFGHAEGLGMPRLQIFAPEAKAFTREQRKQIAQGDMTPYGYLLKLALDDANRIMHEEYDHPGFQRLHFFAAGMGSKALGAAVEMAQASDYEVGAVTLQNLSISDDSLAKFARNYAGRKTSGEAAKLLLPAGTVRIPEPKARQQIDRTKPEWQMRARQAEALGPHPWMVRAIMKANRANEYIEILLENGATLTVANAFNEPMVAQTKDHLPQGESKVNLIDIVGVEGKKVGQIANEHAGLVAVVSANGLKNHLLRTAQ